MYKERTAYTMDELTSILHREILKQLPSLFKIDGSMVVGKKIIFKNNTNNLSAEVFFDDIGIHDHFNGIHVNVINTATQEKGNTATIWINSKKYYPKNMTEHALQLRGGHFWGHDNQFYGHVPNFEMIISEIVGFLTLTAVVKS